MALKKSDLYSSLWKSCDELRGGMDASQYKDYILTLLFVKYVSDKAKADPNSLIDVPEGGSFDDMLAAKGDKEIGDRFNKIIAKLAEANGLRNVIDLADFNDEEKLGKGKEMQDRLSKLVTIFNDLDFRGSRAEGDDLLGDAYEYLMRHFATESGKSKGQFYTPAEVSRILAKVVGINGRDPPGPDRLRPRLWFRLAAAQGGRRGAARHDDLRPGEGQRHLGAVQDEHDPARQRDRRDRQGRHDHQPAVHQRRPAQDLRLRRHEPAVLGQVLEQRPGERLRPLRVRPAAGEERRLRLPAARAQVAQEHRQGGDHPAARRAVPRQRRGHHPHSVCSSTASSRASSACRRTSSTAPASRPASSSSTRRTPSPAPASS